MIKIKNVTRDYWIVNYAWRNRPDDGHPGFVTRNISMGKSFVSEADALADARRKSHRPFSDSDQVSEAWIETRHYQHGVAPRCRKPDMHEVECNRHEICEPVKEAVGE